MKKITIVGAFLCFSLSSLAAMHLGEAETVYREGIFVNREGKVLEGEYEISHLNAKSEFVFQKGELQKFSYHSKEKDDLELEGKFLPKQEYFKGEVSVQEETIKEGLTEKKEISFDGKIEAKELYQFAKEVLTKKETEVKKPSFAKVSSWKIQDGEKVLEEETTQKIEKKEKTQMYSLFQIEEKKSKEVFLEGKVVHSSQSSQVKVEEKKQ